MKKIEEFEFRNLESNFEYNYQESVILLHSLNQSKPLLLKKAFDKKVLEICNHNYSAILEAPSPEPLEDPVEVLKKSFDEDKPISALNWARTRA